MLNYTFILEYRGGTYVSQIKAKNTKQAMVLWAKNLNPNDIKHLGKKRKQIIEKQVLVEEATPLQDMQGVWCFCLDIQGHLGTVNLVETIMNPSLA